MKEGLLQVTRTYVFVPFMHIFHEHRQGLVFFLSHAVTCSEINHVAFFFLSSFPDLFVHISPFLVLTLLLPVTQTSGSGMKVMAAAVRVDCSHLHYLPYLL